jgi:nitrate/nitrite transport system substrate-binding protein
MQAQTKNKQKIFVYLLMTKKENQITRRKFITAVGATTATTLLAHGCTSEKKQSISKDISPIASSDGPEISLAKLGFVSVTDAAPLVIAKEKGLFAKYGMKDLELVKQASWATTRDALVLGSGGGGIDGAHVLFTMSYLIHTGEITNKKPVPMYILNRLNVNGQGISVGNKYKQLNLSLDSSPLKKLLAADKASGKNIKCAVPFARVTGDFFMRWWLAAGGMEPDKDVSVIVIPPPQMVANMKTGNMEAFCVVEPWHKQLINQDIGYTALTSGELWGNHPEKSLTMRADWVDKHPKATKAILMAVLEAQIWCDKPENKDEMVKIISQRKWFNVPEKDIIDRVKGRFDYGTGKVVENSPHLIKFWSDNASYPFKSHDLWFLIEDMRWGYRSPDTDTKKLIDAVNREDLWREAAKGIGQEAAIPKSTSRGVEKFFNGLEFDPENPQAYLKSPKVKTVS